MAKKLSRRDFIKLTSGGAAALTLGGLPFAVSAQDGITVRYVTPQWASTRDRRPERQIAFRSVIDSFNNMNNDLSVQEIVGTGDVVGTSQSIENGEGDVYWVEKSWYAALQETGIWADLTPYLEVGEEEAFFPFTIEFLRSINGELGGLWHNTDTPLFYYNTSLIESPPETWDELVSWAADWRANNDNYAISIPYNNWMQLFGGNMERLGGAWVDADGVPVVFEHRDILFSIMQPFVDMIENDLVPGENVLNDHNSQMPLIYAGDAASFFGNSNLHIRALQPNLPPDEYAQWGATTLPYPAELAGQQRAYTAGGWVIAALKNDDEAAQAAAAEWVKHATSPTSLAVTNTAGGWVPTRPGVIENDPFYQEDVIMQTTLAALNEHGYIPPGTSSYVIVFQAVTEALQAAASGQLSLDDALNEAEGRIEREYADLS